jgi:glycosyltransferase involved in cell wall biosynthesis
MRAEGKVKTELELHIVGQTYFKKLGEKIKIFPSMPLRELNTKIEQSKFVIFALPDREYSIGQTSLLQTMLLGKAVVVNHNKTVHDYLLRNDVYLNFPTGDWQQLAEKIIMLTQNKTLRQEMGQRNRQYVKDNFSEEKMALNVYQLLRGLS